MLKNINYNLLEEITELSQSLYRYDTYMKDAESAGCGECLDLWRELRERHEQDLDRLLKHFKQHIDSGMIEFGRK